MKAIKVILTLTTILLVGFTNAQNGYQVGDKIEDFKLKNIDGKMVSLSDYEDSKGFIVTFTCNTCPYANMYEERIIELDKKFASQGFPVIAIMPNNTKVKPGDSFEEMQKRAKEKGYTFPYLIDSKQTIYPKFGATKTPHTYIIEKTSDGYIVRYIGAIDDNYRDASAVKQKYVEAALEAIMKGEQIEVTETKAIGCTIKV